MSLLEVEMQAGTPIHVGQTRIIPFAQTFRLNLPGADMIWSRPTAVLAQTPDGQEAVTLIQDVTRQIQLAFFSVGVLGALILWFWYQKNSSGDSDDKQ
jgi:hypothetical protein